MTASSTATPTDTASGTVTSTGSQTATRTLTGSPSSTGTVTATGSATTTRTATGSPTSTWSFTSTPTPTGSGTGTPTVTLTSTISATGSITPTGSATPSVTATPTRTSTGSQTPTGTRSPSGTGTPSSTMTATVTPSATASGSFTASPTDTITPTFTLTFTPTDTPTPVEVVTQGVPTGVTYTCHVATTDGAVLDIPAGTFSAPVTMTVERFTSNPAPTPGVTSFIVLGTAYQINAGGATLLQPVVLTFPYDPAQVPAGKDPATYLTMAYYDGVSWTQLSGGTVNTTAHTVSVTTSHFSVWAVVGKIPPTPVPTPALAVAPLGTTGFFINPVVRRGQPLCTAQAKPLSSSDWTLYNMAGQKVATLSQDGPQACLQTYDLAPGLYILKAKSTFADGSAADDMKKIVILP